MRAKIVIKLASFGTSALIAISSLAFVPTASAQESQPNLPNGHFLVPIGAGPVNFSDEKLEMDGPLCQVDGERLIGLTYEIYDAMCMLAQVRAVQEWYIYSSGAVGKAVGGWISMPGEVSSATRPSGSEHISGYAEGRYTR